MLRVRVIGGLEAAVDGVARPLPDRRPGRSLLAWLALHPGAHARADVAAALWPDAAPDAALASLRSALASIRRALGDDAAQHLHAGRADVGLVDARCDADDVREAASADEALALCRGELLQGLDDPWVLDAREEHRSTVDELLARAARNAEGAGDTARAAELTRRRLALDPLAEPVARDLVRLLAAAGDRAGALQAYGRFAERLHAELGLAPARETRELLTRLGDEAPADGAPAARDTGLPTDDAALAALPPGAAPAERAELLLALADARRRDAAPVADVRDTYLRAAGLAADAGRPDLRARAAMGVCALPWFPGDAPVDDVAVNLLTETLGGAPRPLALRLRAHLARERLLGPDAAAARDEVTDVLRDARRAGEPHALAAALDVWSVALAGTTAPGERRAAGDELIAAATEAGDAVLELRGRVWRTVAALEQDDLAVAATEGEAIERRAAALGEASWPWWPALWRAMAALAAGRLEEGERLAWAAYAIGERPFAERAALEFQAQLFWIRWRQGRLHEIESSAAAAAERHDVLPVWRCVGALVRAELGDKRAARAVLADIAEDGFAALPPDLGRLTGLSLAAEAAIAADDADTKQAAKKALAEYAGRRPVSGYGGLVLDPVDATLERL